MYRYVVEDNTRLTGTINLLTVRYIGDGNPLLYQPGQYAAIGFKKNFRPTAVRCFSIASSPEEQDRLQFSIRIKGRYTSAVKKIVPGDELFVRGPFGGFVMDVHEDNDVVFFAGGIGIAPFMGMIEHVTNLHLHNNIHLIYSCQNQNDIPFFEKLQSLKARNNKLEITFVIGEGPINLLEGERVALGRVDGDMLDKLGLDYSTQKFFMCGPPPYMKAIMSLLRERNVSSDMIITEAFGQGANRQTGAIRSWPFNIYALTSLGLIIGGFIIMTLDLSKTIPSLENSTVITPLESNGFTIKTDGKGQKAAINSVAPTIDTNIKQPAVVVEPASSTPVQTNTTPKPGQTGNATTAPSVAPTPTTPKPVVTPPPPPVSTVS